MDIFLKILLLLIALGFIFLGVNFFFRGKQIIQAIQKYRYKITAEPRKQELVMAKIMGLLLVIVGLYYAIAAILAFL